MEEFVFPPLPLKEEVDVIEEDLWVPIVNSAEQEEVSPIISDRVNLNVSTDQVSSMRVVVLKINLNARGLLTTGRVPELRERLTQAIIDQVPIIKPIERDSFTESILLGYGYRI